MSRCANRWGRSVIECSLLNYQQPILLFRVPPLAGLQLHRGSTGRYEVTSAGGERVLAFIPVYDGYLEILNEGTEL